jgi:hypothetical protein
MNTKENQTQEDESRSDLFLAVAERFRESSDEKEIEALGNQLGGLIFGE